MTWKEFACLLRGHNWCDWRRLVTVDGGLHVRRTCHRCGNVETNWMLSRGITPS